MKKTCIGITGILSLCLLLSSCGGRNQKMDPEMIPVRENDKTLFLDLSGKVVLEVENNNVWYFSEGVALFWEDGRYGYINKKGKTVIDPQYKYATSFQEGIAWVVAENGHPQAINPKGKVLFTLEQATKVNAFRDGLAVFETEDEEGKTLYGCVNKSGKVVIAPQENELSDFSEGKAPIRSSDNKKKGYVNKKGEIVINCQFDDAGDFSSHGYACVEFGGQ
ncbi:MAG: WG repeat-containing protein [Candidatus Azobacteroides sp.]|nr:WG repeat-containing protein [Candidatus Azobacteroides sp.]